MSLSPAEARAFRARWRAVAAAEAAELRRTTLAERLRVLAGLMRSVRALGGNARLRAEDAVVRRRWMQLRRALGGQSSRLTPRRGR